MIIYFSSNSAFFLFLLHFFFTNLNSRRILIGIKKHEFRHREEEVRFWIKPNYCWCSLIIIIINFISQHNVNKKDKVTFRYIESNLESCETDACTKLWACVTSRQVPTRWKHRILICTHTWQMLTIIWFRFHDSNTR